MAASVSSGSICDLWGVTYPSDFIPGGGGQKQHRQYRLHHQNFEIQQQQ